MASVRRELVARAKRFPVLVRIAGKARHARSRLTTNLKPQASVRIVDGPPARAQQSLRFAIMCMGRSGSTLLQTMLDSHPDVRCFSELFIPAGPFDQSGLSDPGVFVNRTFEAEPYPAVGFKLPWNSLITHPGALTVLRRQRFRVILLTRQNKLDQYLSMKLSSLNGVWHSFNGRYTTERLRVDPDECLHTLQYFRFGEIMLRESVHDLLRVEVEYQQIVCGQGLAPVFDLLGVTPRLLTPGVQRLRQGRQRDIVENYDELKARFIGTEWEDDFED